MRKLQEAQALAKEITTELGISAQMEHVTDFKAIASNGVLATPGLVIDEELVCADRVPSKAEVSTFITSVLAWRMDRR